MKIEYFGTTLTEKGHLRRMINEHGELDWKTSLDFSDLDFDQETTPSRNLRRGNMAVFETEKHVVCFISGSPIDTRSGCKSVFFTKEKISRVDFLSHLKGLKFFNELIEKIVQ